MDVNCINIIGRLGKAPEFRVTQTGIPVCSFSVATKRRSRDGNGATDWHTVKWYNYPTIANRLKQGTLVHVSGAVWHNSYETSDGSKRYYTEIPANEVNVLGGLADEEQGKPAPAQESQGRPGNSNAGSSQQGTPPKPVDNSGGFEDDDLPF